MTAIPAATSFLTETKSSIFADKASEEEKKAYDAIPDTDKITHKDLKQGTITVSNIGADTRGISGECAMLMVIPPQVCAICVGSLQRRPVVTTDETFVLPVVNENIGTPNATPNASIMASLSVPASTIASKIDAGELN